MAHRFTDSAQVLHQGMGKTPKVRKTGELRPASAQSFGRKGSGEVSGCPSPRAGLGGEEHNPLDEGVQQPIIAAPERFVLGLTFFQSGHLSVMSPSQGPSHYCNSGRGLFDTNQIR